MEEINKIILTYFQKKIKKIDLLNMFYDIGEIIEKNKIDLKELELFLKNEYGISIVFTKRNFKNMIKLYNKYQKEELIDIQQYVWYDVIQILNNKKINNYEIDYCLIELNELKKIGGKI